MHHMVLLDVRSIPLLTSLSNPPSGAAYCRVKHCTCCPSRSHAVYNLNRRKPAPFPTPGAICWAPAPVHSSILPFPSYLAWKWKRKRREPSKKLRTSFFGETGVAANTYTMFFFRYSQPRQKSHGCELLAANILYARTMITRAFISLYTTDRLVNDRLVHFSG